LNIDYQVREGINCLKNGGIVGFPTETVFGLGANADDVDAVAKVYSVKSRPRGHPLILHLAKLDEASAWVEEIPPAAYTLAKAFWPGPLTLVLKAKSKVANHFSGNFGTIAIRVPSHPIARALIIGLGRGIVAPSANRFGRLSPTSASDVFEELGGKVDLIIEAESCSIGIESTIVDLTEDMPVILRPGIIDQEKISMLLGKDVVERVSKTNKAPGSHPVHYAPNTPLTVVYRDQLEKFLHKDTNGLSVAVLGRSIRPQFSGAAVWQVAPTESLPYAKNLYSLLRRLDKSGCELIAVEEPPYSSEWMAVHDRLKKSCIPKMALVEFIRNVKEKKFKNIQHGKNK